MQRTHPLVEKVWRYCAVNAISARTVTVKIKYSDFTQATRSRTLPAPLTGPAGIAEIATTLLSTVYPFKRPIRLLGVTLSSLDAAANQPVSQLKLAL